MRIMFTFLFLVFFSDGLLAQDSVRTEVLLVRSLDYSAEKKLYRLHIAGRAGAYYAPRSMVDCIKHSISKKEGVEMTFNSKSLVISSCKIKP
jgi:hypothetical protein